ncbi:MAG: SDR family oxidoreductase [Pseudomonadota bacterium]
MTQKSAALVTGAGKRLGRAMALALAQDGFPVVVHYNSSADDAERVVSEIVQNGGKACHLQANLGNEHETHTLIERSKAALGPLSLLINSASLFESDDIETMSRTSWEEHIETNLRAPLKLTQDFAAQAIDGDNNLVVNLIDQRVLKLTPQFLSYTTSKAALLTLTKTLAQALAPKGIRVNGIGPGPTLRNKRQSEEDWQRQNEATPLGKGAGPDDIVAALRYLIHARPVTGQMIAVDGGQHLTWQTPDVLVNE